MIKVKKHTFYDLFEKLEDLQAPLQAKMFFEALQEMYGVGPVIYNQVNGPLPTHDNCFLEGTYPLNWLEHYFESGYFNVDPVAQQGLIRKSPFDWHDLPRNTPVVQQIFNEWIDAGFGQQGLTIPLATATGIKATLNFSADMTDRDWHALRPDLLHDLSILGQFYHHKICKRMNALTSASSLDLHEREIECLKWAASGKTIWETSVILCLSERNVRYHLDQARRKLHCKTKIQAVAKAVATGIINIS